MNSNIQSSISLEEKIRIRDFRNMKIAIWVYFFLLIFEGAIRKWILPGLSDVFLVVRDPVAIYLLILTIKQRIFKGNNYIFINYGACIIAFISTMIWGHANLIVAIYGLRIYALHFPIIFIIARVFTVKDVLQLGKILLWLSVPMAILIAIQFYSPQSAWVNRGIGGSLDGAGFQGANGYMRPPGVFSFISGSVLFWGLITAFTLFFIIENKIISRYWVVITIFSILIALAFSISRSLFFGVIISVLAFLVTSGRKPHFFLSTILFGVLLLIVGYFFSKLDIFNVGIDAFITRFTSANETEGGLKGVFIDRFLGGMIGAITNDPNLSFWGKGIGMGTNAGAKLMTGNLIFLISEGEWGRLIGESGLFLGLTFILLRVVLACKMLFQSIQFIRRGNTLPWMLLSFGFLIIIQGQWAQPTNLGFAVLTGGLILTAMKKPYNQNKRNV